jgi:hypothetical protein
MGVPIAGTLLHVAVNLADEAVHIHNESILARTGTRRPRPPEAVSEHPVELADMPERERPQERTERRRS